MGNEHSSYSEGAEGQPGAATGVWPPQPGQRAQPGSSSRAQPGGGQPWGAQPGWQQSPQYQAPGPKSRFGIGVLVGFFIGIAISGVVAVIGFVAFVVFMSSTAPANLGDSVTADALYAQCSEGGMSACDTLYWESALGSELEEFGATCGGRVPWQQGGCVATDLEGQSSWDGDAAPAVWSPNA